MTESVYNWAERKPHEKHHKPNWNADKKQYCSWFSQFWLGVYWQLYCITLRWWGNQVNETFGLRPWTYLPSDSNTKFDKAPQSSEQGRPETNLDARNLLYISLCRRTTDTTIQEVANHSMCEWSVWFETKSSRKVQHERKSINLVCDKTNTNKQMSQIDIKLQSRSQRKWCPKILDYLREIDTTTNSLFASRASVSKMCPPE